MAYQKRLKKSTLEFYFKELCFKYYGKEKLVGPVDGASDVESNC